MGGKVWGGYQPLEGVTTYARFFVCGRAAAHAHGSGSARARGRTGTQAALGSFSFARRRKIGRERRQFSAKRLAILVDARKSKRQREGSLSELNPPALEPRDG